MQLSQRRAQSVMDYLASHGIAAARLRSKGYGETHPLAPTIRKCTAARTGALSCTFCKEPPNSIKGYLQLFAGWGARQ
jgi:hypothetical protein